MKCFPRLTTIWIFFIIIYQPFIHALRLFRALRLLFLSIFPGPTVIPCPTSIPDTRTFLYIVILEPWMMNLCLGSAPDNHQNCQPNLRQKSTLDAKMTEARMYMYIYLVRDINSPIYFHGSSNIVLTKFGVMIILMMLWNAFWCPLKIYKWLDDFNPEKTTNE